MFLHVMRFVPMFDIVVHVMFRIFRQFTYEDKLVKMIINNQLVN